MTMLIESCRGFAHPWQMNHVGHMNVQFYTARFDETTWHFFARPGLTPGFLKDNNRGMDRVGRQDGRVMARRGRAVGYPVK
jgi:acyl-CoA thioester hydrolase